MLRTGNILSLSQTLKPKRINSEECANAVIPTSNSASIYKIRHFYCKGYCNPIVRAFIFSKCFLLFVRRIRLCFRHIEAIRISKSPIMFPCLRSLFLSLPKILHTSWSIDKTVIPSRKVSSISRLAL